MKPHLSHLNPDNPLSPQLRVDGGELSTKCEIVDHLLDNFAQLFHIRNISINQDIADGKLTLVAFCRASSAKLQNLDQNIHTELEAVKSIVVKEEQALGRMSKH